MKIPQMVLGAIVSLGAAGLADVVQAQDLFFEGDMVRGRDRNLGASGPTCVLASQFMRGEHVVWRVRVVGEDGENLGDDALQSLVIEISDGEQFEMGFGEHPREERTDAFWATSWAVPPDYPTGTIAYKVIATDTEGNTHEWEPFDVASSKLTVVPGEVTWEK